MESVEIDLASGRTLIHGNPSKEDVIKNWSVNRVFMPTLEKEVRDERVKGWNKAVKYAYGWAKEESYGGETNECFNLNTN